MPEVCQGGAVVNPTLVPLVSGGRTTPALLRAELEAALSAYLDRAGLRAAGMAAHRHHSTIHDRGASIDRWPLLELVSALASDQQFREDAAVAMLQLGLGQPLEADTDCRRTVTALAARTSALAKRLEDQRIDRDEASATADELTSLVPLVLQTIADCRAKAHAVRR
jgi:hypothetical protein